MTDKLAEMQSIAAHRGGKCLSERYGNAKSSLEWSCAEGHVWPAAPDKIKQGEWCPVCARHQPHSIVLMQELAARRGGHCLSHEYRNTGTPLLWQCHDSHRWKAAPSSIIAGTWCPYCARTARLTRTQMQRIARRRGGRLLSETYENNSIPLHWECKRGHHWWATANKVKGSKRRHGTWCPVCARQAAAGHSLFEPLQLDDIRRLARDRGGECLATSYVNNHTPMLFRCTAGHEWMLRAKDLKRGQWCPVCARRAPRTIEEMQAFAYERGGRCVSAKYHNLHTPLKWQCAAGHTWMAIPANVLRRTWCPICAGNQTGTLAELVKLARSKGGECLSKRYVNALTPVEWRCAKGHTWRAPAARVKPSRYGNGNWCPICAVEQRTMN